MKVVPSQIVQFIKEHINWINPSSHQLGLSDPIRGALSALLRLVDNVPDHLMPTEPNFGKLALAIETIRTKLRQAESVPPNPNVEHVLVFSRDGNPVAIIREVLEYCPDERAKPQTSGLVFIDDEALRESIRADMSAAESAFANFEWKASTVLAGAAVEALLLSALEKVKTKKPNLFNGSTKVKKLGKDLEERHWGLSSYIDLARELDLITEQTKTLADLTKDFRDLIHPGKTKRENRTCTRATALSALAGVAHIAEDLE